MTITEPHGEPTLLQTVLQVEHDRLQLLVDESRKHSPTPGVHEKVIDELRTALAAHLDATEKVVHPAAGELPPDERGRLDSDRRSFRDLFENADPDLEWTAVAVQRHIDTCNDVLRRVAATVDDRRLANLGFEYSAAIEAGPAR
jgi:hypothetical protein